MLETNATAGLDQAVTSPSVPPTRASGRLILNADDWGRDRLTTDRTLDCFRAGGISSVSAMVFMEDSERAADVAIQHKMDAGLHLNVSTNFSARGVSARLLEHQERVSRYLMGNRIAQVVFHPGLVKSFEYVVAAQRHEYMRLYGSEPVRMDGHHHMHLAANVMLQRLMPSGTRVRRNFSFQPGEKSFVNRSYRGLIDQVLQKRHILTDFFFSLPPLDPARLARMISLSREWTVELETHPVNQIEYRFLSSGELSRWGGEDVRIAPTFAEPRGC